VRRARRERITRLKNSEEIANRDEKLLKINERPTLFRVQDARAALPQNCSPANLVPPDFPAYSTSVPYRAG